MEPIRGCAVVGASVVVIRIAIIASIVKRLAVAAGPLALAGSRVKVSRIDADAGLVEGLLEIEGSAALLTVHSRCDIIHVKTPGQALAHPRDHVVVRLADALAHQGRGIDVGPVGRVAVVADSGTAAVGAEGQGQVAGHTSPIAVKVSENAPTDAAQLLPQQARSAVRAASGGADRAVKDAGTASQTKSQRVVVVTRWTGGHAGPR